MNNLFFTIWVVFGNISRIYFFFFSIQIFKSNCYIIVTNFFQSSFSDWNFIRSQLCLSIKRLIFVIFSGSFPISSWVIATVTAYWRHLLSFLLAGFIYAFVFFIPSGVSVYIQNNSGLFYDIYNTMNEHNKKQTHYVSLIPNYFWVVFFLS